MSRAKYPRLNEHQTHLLHDLPLYLPGPPSFSTSSLEGECVCNRLPEKVL